MTSRTETGAGAGRSDLSRYIRVDISDARINASWARVSRRLSPRANDRRGWMLGGAFAAAVAVVSLSLLFLGNSRTASVWQNAALQTAGDTLAVDLEDGSRLELSAHTRLELSESAPQSVRLELQKGGVHCEVAPNAKRRFSVVAAGVEVRVTGTRFSVSVAPSSDRVDVQVTKGSVEVTVLGEAKPARRLLAGERWSVERPLERKSIESAEATALAPSATALPQRSPAVSRPTEGSPSVGSERLAVGSAPSAVGSGSVEAESERSLETGSARELLEIGNAARRTGDIARAARAYELLLAKYPKDGRAGLAAFELGRLRMDRLGNPAGAVQALQRAITHASGAGFREDAMARLVSAHAALGANARCREAQKAYLRAYPAGVHASSVASKCGPP